MNEEPRYPIETFRQIAITEGIVSPEDAAEIEYIGCPHCDALTLLIPEALFPLKAEALIRLLHTLQYGNVN